MCTTAEKKCSVRPQNFDNPHVSNSTRLFQFNNRLVFHRKECVVLYLYRTMNTVQTFFKCLKLKMAWSRLLFYLENHLQVEGKKIVITLALDVKCGYFSIRLAAIFCSIRSSLQIDKHFPHSIYRLIKEHKYLMEIHSSALYNESAFQLMKRISTLHAECGDVQTTKLSDLSLYDRLNQIRPQIKQSTFLLH